MNGKPTWRFAAILVAAWSALLFLLLPVFVAYPVSLTSKRYLSMPEGEYSLRHYQTLLSVDAWRDSIATSAVIATSATALAVLLGTLCAIGMWRIANRLTELVRGLMLLPLIVPPIVSALAFYRLYIDLRILDTMVGTILAHAVLAVPYVVITVSASLANFDTRLEQAARSLGATMGETLRYVILPSIMPGVLSGAVFAFVASWDELVVTLFITSRKVFTLPRRMWDGIRDNLDPAIAACAALLITIALVAMLVHVLRESARLRSARASEASS